jgi:hypothetical protein
MSWDEYKAIITSHWNSLLDSNPSELRVQAFLDTHPCLVPGAFGPGPSGHYPFPGGLISQPVLPGLRRPRPDFMWIALDSSTIRPMLIELESPSKRWFGTKGRTTQKFNEARDQLSEWKAWFSSPSNTLQFLEFYRLESFIRHRELKPTYILVIGRRSEATAHNRLRASLAAQDELIMTYDRLSPDANTSELMCCTVTGQRYVAHTMPPTLTLGPGLAEYRMLVEQKEKATMASPYLSQQRKDFLSTRFAYWDKWAATPSGLIHSGDKE